MEYTFSKLLEEAKNILSEMRKHLPPKEPNQTTTIVDKALDEIKEPNQTTTIVDPVLGEIDKIEDDMKLLEGMMEYESRLDKSNKVPINSTSTKQQVKEDRAR